MRSASMSVVLGAAIAVAGVAPRASAMVGPAAGAGAKDEQLRAEGNALMDEGDAHQAVGAHVEAARAYAKAFDAFARRAKADGKEKQAVSLAVDEFTAAQAQEPGSLALLEEEAALLERFVARVGDETAMVEERTRVKGRIEALKREQAEAERREREAAAKEEEAREAKGTGQAGTEPEAGAVVVGGEDEPRPPRKGGAAILSVGVASVVGGVALVASGAWNLGNVRRRGDEKLAAIDANDGGTPEMREALRGDIDEWRKEWRGIGTGLVVGGAVLAAAGVGLTTWGVVRMRRGKRRVQQARVVRPMISGRGVGLIVTGRW